MNTETQSFIQKYDLLDAFNAEVPGMSGGLRTGLNPRRVV